MEQARRFVTRAKANPGKFNMGNSGTGSPPHIASELLMVQGGISYTQVPYAGAGLAVQAVLGKSIDASSTAVPPAENSTAFLAAASKRTNMSIS